MKHRACRRSGFSLVELMVVLTIIVILLGLLGSLLFKSSITAAYTAACASNLNQNRLALGHNTYAKRMGTTVPEPESWMEWLVDGTKLDGGTACCPEDPACSVAMSGLQGYYIRQKHGASSVYYTSIHDLISGKPVNDPQAYYRFQGQVHGMPEDNTNDGLDGWVGWFDLELGPPNDDDLDVAFNNDTGMRFTFNEDGTITARALARGPNSRMGSDHWFGFSRLNQIGTPQPTWEAEVLLTLSGATNGLDYIDPKSPLALEGNPLQTSYGMNTNLSVHDDAYGDKLLLVDYEEHLIRTTPDGQGNVNDVFNELPRRHAGRDNALFVDGSVRQMSPDELDPLTNEHVWIKD
jgi:prepilin-type N-terminal cleavage/methylation domain-containing protein/prepilin-type processing-associated H-X9-DG protein